MPKSNPLKDTVKYITLLLGVFCVLYPPYIIVANAFKTREEFNEKPAIALPDSFLNFSNFGEAFKSADMLLAFKNMLIIMVAVLILNVLLSAAFCYAVGRFKFKGSGLIIGLFMFATIIPGITTQVVNFKTIQALGLHDRLSGTILLYVGADILAIFMFLQFIRNIPAELDEAAMMEGASLFKIFTMIIFPLLAPATATVVILKAINIYNDFFVPLLYLPSPENVVVSTSLMRFFGNNSGDWQMISAAVLMIMIPNIVMYLLLQRFIFAGVTNGAVK